MTLFFRTLREASGFLTIVATSSISNCFFSALTKNLPNMLSTAHAKNPMKAPEIIWYSMEFAHSNVSMISVDPMIADPVEIPPLIAASSNVTGFMKTIEANPPNKPPNAAAIFAPTNVAYIGIVLLKKEGCSIPQSKIHNLLYSIYNIRAIIL